MIWQLYSVFDSKACVYERPFCAHNDASAVRSFGDIAVDEQHPIGQHPEDYSLWWIGSFDDSNGVVKPGNRKQLHSALELKSMRQAMSDNVVPIVPEEEVN